jgi:peptidyl-prolyl cis-trans isomerase C
MSARRIRSVLAVVALAAMTFALCAATPARTPARKPARRAAVADSNEVLVKFGRESITRGDVQRRIDTMPEQFRSNYTTPEGRRQLLDRMIEERVWLLEATRHGVPERPQVKQQIEQQRRDLLIRTYLNELMTRNPAVSDSEARMFYEAHVSEFKIPGSANIRHIQTKSEADAKRVKQALKAGQDWVQLAKKFSTDTLTRATGGNLGVVTREGAFGSLGTQTALAESAFALKEGQMGGPWKSDKGWHIVRVDQMRPESTRPFDQVKALVTRQMGSQRQQDFYKMELDSVRRALGITVDSTAVKRFMSVRRTPREMFNDAQALGPPEQRIEAYQKLLDEYPSSEVSPQAQFMIGFINSEELKKYDEAEKAFRALLARYPKAELAPSAHWMIDHMRTTEAPAFVNADSIAATPPGGEPRKPAVAPPGSGATPARVQPPPRSGRTYKP